MNLDSKIPEGPLEQKWDSFKSNMKLINPSNKRKYKVLVVGTGLAGASAAASLAELGYQVETFCFQDSPRRAHSIAAQGGINAAKNYQNDGDSIWRLFYDTIKGGDFRSREANVYRLAQMSVKIIDHCVALGDHSPASMAAFSTTAALVAHRFPEPSIAEARQASNFFWAPTAPWQGRLPKAELNPTHVPKCSTSSTSMAEPGASSFAISKQAKSNPTLAMQSCLQPVAMAPFSFFQPTQWVVMLLPRIVPIRGVLYLQTPASPKSTRPASP